jgi:hypothetical protein
MVQHTDSGEIIFSTHSEQRMYGLPSAPQSPEAAAQVATALRERYIGILTFMVRGGDTVLSDPTHPATIRAFEHAIGGLHLAHVINQKCGSALPDE